MEISKETRKRMMQIIAFGILLYCGMEHFDVVIGAVDFVLGIVMPFLVGGAIAFVINVPMKSIERHLFAKNGKLAKWRRPVAYLLTLALVIGIITLALVVVIPELGNTISMIVQQVPVAVKAVQKWLTDLPHSYPALAPAVAELNIDWSSLADSIVTFVQNFAAGVVSSGVGIFSGIVSGVVTFVIAFTFSIYVLFQKERLARQAKQILYAVFPEKATEKILSVAALSNQVFSSFLSGQCVEAVILGTLFVITMSILGMPYAMLTGIVIAITALIPIFGAFIGCVIGMLLIVMVDPVQAVWFLVLFLVLQQIEGNLIYPHVVGSSVGLPSIWVLVAVTVGGNMFGILGILVFIPLCSVLYALFAMFVKKRLREREVPESRWNAQSGGAAAAGPEVSDKTGGSGNTAG
ncbi:AI-2E family transporter [Roseburia hominis]|uniref:AI-2E family transporter n=1 Tax=Roseburia hominis TaxID=301301 RepID=UPI0026665630|nr:AI-2E family transporter [Roseburia hominis]